MYVVWGGNMKNCRGMSKRIIEKLGNYSAPPLVTSFSQLGANWGSWNNVRITYQNLYLVTSNIIVFC